MENEKEMDDVVKKQHDLMDILKKYKETGSPVQRDIATHALMLIMNGWEVQAALDESEKTLDEAEVEGKY